MALRQISMHIPMRMGTNSIAIVHNGIIENYQEIKEWLIRDYGVKFKSETDSEVIAHLIGIYYDGDLLPGCQQSSGADERRLCGSGYRCCRTG